MRGSATSGRCFWFQLGDTIDSEANLYAPATPRRSVAICCLFVLFCFFSPPLLLTKVRDDVGVSDGMGRWGCEG